MRYPTPALWRADIDVVHDGDTVQAKIDRGFNDTSQIWVRLKDVYAPELREAGGIDVRDYVIEWLVEHNHEQAHYYAWSVETFRTPRSDVDAMTFDRYLGIVRCSQGHNMNQDVTAFILLRGYGGGTGS
jgi:hypothetical protein